MKKLVAVFVFLAIVGILIFFALKGAINAKKITEDRAAAIEEALSLK